MSSSEPPQQQQLSAPALHLKKVLKSYQAAAVSSLSGPGTFMSSWSCSSSSDESPATSKAPTTSSDDDDDAPDEPRPPTAASRGGDDGDYDPLLAPPPFPIQQMPIFTPADQTRSDRSDTILEGETISSFVVGGERRLCLPQILNTVLRDFSLQQINVICDDLHIFCSRCNQEQLDELKMVGILPVSAPSCGLITKTDAERLCTALLHRNPPRAAAGIRRKLTHSVPVFHACFGKCRGLVYPELYLSPDSLAVECCECQGLFSPEKFVCHVHKSRENRTCHWGFDSLNWRSYLLLVKAQSNASDLQKHLDEVKARFDFISTQKRKQGDEIKEYTKKVKSEDAKINQCVGKPQIGTPYWCKTPVAVDPWMSPINWAVYRNWVEKQQQITSQLIQSTMLKHGSRSDMLKLPSYVESHPSLLLKPGEEVDVSAYERLATHYQHHMSNGSTNAQSQSYPKMAHFNQEKKLRSSKEDDKCQEIDLSTHSEDSSCSTVTAAGSEYEMKDEEVNERIEEIRQILEQQKLEESAIDNVMKKVMKIKSIYVNKLLQIVYDSEELSRTEVNQVNKKLVDASPVVIKAEVLECAD